MPPSINSAARVGGEDVDAAEGLVEFFEDALYVRFLGDVAFKQQHLTAFVADGFGQRIRGYRVAMEI